MAFITIFGNWTNGYMPTAEYESWILDTDASITTTPTPGFNFGSVHHVSLFVEGTIKTSSFAVAGSQAWYANLRISDTGRLEAIADAVNLSGPNVVVSNMGTIISTTGDGVNISGLNWTINNSGTIKGEETGVYATLNGGQAFNSGLIRATGEMGTGMLVNITPTTSACFVENSGRIVGDTGMAVTDGEGMILNTGKIIGLGGTAFLGVDAQHLTNKGEIIGDVLFGSGDDTFRGSGSVDGKVSGGAGDDELRGGKTADRLFGDEDGDRLFGFGGNDQLKGGTGGDLLNGGKGNDKLWGGAENDVIYSGSGKDRLYGGDGDDALIAERGNDIMIGGAGEDTFVFQTKTIGTDRIKDFTVGEDTLNLSGLTFQNNSRFWNKAVSKVKGDLIIDLKYGGGKGKIIIEDVAKTFSEDDVFFGII
jgi:Ca2+-binding RTX toxin-like protein